MHASPIRHCTRGAGARCQQLRARCRTLQSLKQHLYAAHAGEVAEATGELGEETALAELLSRERRLRDRSSALCVPGKSFKVVLDILEAAQVGAHSPHSRPLMLQDLYRAPCSIIRACCMAGWAHCSHSCSLSS